MTAARGNEPRSTVGGQKLGMDLGMRKGGLATWLAMVTILGSHLCLACNRAPQPARQPAPPPAALDGLFLDVPASGLACERLMDQFIGIPGEGASPGPQSSLAPKEGRLWVQSCQIDRFEQFLRVRISGPGWLWVDREEKGARLRQQVYFRVVVDMSGVLNVAYDQGARVASAYLAPVRVAKSRVTPVGTITASPETLFLGIVDEVVPELLPREARLAVAKKGSLKLEAALAQGGTLTYDLDRRQFDFALGLLPKGTQPSRPFGATGKWWAHERIRVRPGAPHILGPFSPALRGS